MRWGSAGDTTGELCSTNCHNVAASALPSNGTQNDPVRWAAVTLPPPTLPHQDVDLAVDDVDCGGCHVSSDSYCDCLSCHTNGIADGLMGVVPAGSDWGADTEVDKFFASIGDTAITIANHSSEHDVVYNTGGDLCTQVDNECLKCHSATFTVADGSEGHPGVSAGDSFLFYPDNIDARVVNAGIVRPEQTDGAALWNAYQQEGRQDFCLSCHDGVDSAGVGAARFQFGGPPLYGVGPLNVPTVPLTVFNMPPAVAANTPPFFAFYNGNGHGIAQGIEATPMNMTCLSGPAAPAGTPRLGCHSAHGTANIYNLEDTNFTSADGVNTLKEMGDSVCMSASCHNDARRALYTGDLFHTWLGDGGFLHVGYKDTPTPRTSTDHWDSVAAARSPSFPPRQTAQTTPNLWFFAGINAQLPIAGSRAVTGVFDGAPREIGCITCHDPHGTSTVWQSAPWSTMGMVKRFITTMDSNDALCGECH
jgi:hypothetical protein